MEKEGFMPSEEKKRQKRERYRPRQERGSKAILRNHAFLVENFSTILPESSCI